MAAAAKYGALRLTRGAISRADTSDQSGTTPRASGYAFCGGLWCMALKTLPCSGDDAPPQHRSILRVLHPVTPHKKHIRLLRISSPIDPTRRIRTKGLLWGSRGTFPPTATMVVMVVVAVGLLGCSSHQPLYCRNSTYFPRK